MEIAILGTTGHIAKGLVENFIKHTDDHLYVFTRELNKMDSYPIALPSNRVTVLTNSLFNDRKYDAVINCAGIGDPGQIKIAGSQIFSVTEYFDNLVLEYLKKRPECKYLNLSSGAVYGKETGAKITASSKFKLLVNQISSKDFYAMAKLNSEVKHRSYSDFWIVDLRVFSYFSHYIGLDTKFLMTEIVNCLLRKETFITDDNDIVRDYIGPDELFALTKLCLALDGRQNYALDVYSKKPITKMELLAEFEKSFGLRWEVNTKSEILQAHGKKNQYFTQNKKAAEIGYKPKRTSLEVLKHETNLIINKMK